MTVEAAYLTCGQVEHKITRFLALEPIDYSNYSPVVFFMLVLCGFIVIYVVLVAIESLDMILM